VQEFHYSNDHAGKLEYKRSRKSYGLLGSRQSSLMIKAHGVPRSDDSHWTLEVGSWKLEVGRITSRGTGDRSNHFLDRRNHQLGGGLEIFVERDGERMRAGLRVGGRQVNGMRVKVEFYSR